MEESSGPRRRRRAVRPSDAEDIDRSWDSPEAAELFADAADVSDPRASDDFIVVLDDSEADDTPDNGELDEEFWKDQRPPHSG
ncbi:hypothetical protein CKALI_08355 [Corynebacterium kalinowskii]|uniref:Uncharacterized protein n=1 Tax=Corynebacterium kalinowskii TaxID=2675216 RepID=A0A6B8VRN7_9CORY|nr:hypothetical protein [Corynebacterium kalinowskii]QGU02531.1 hypothetical protein CKALI_08355 [Corynebacterium kalinowskii]